MAITMQYEIIKTLNNLAMATAAEKDVLAQITSIIKNLADTNKILMEQVNTLMEI